MPQKVNHVLLATALVEVQSQSGAKLCARILLDSGSQVNFITEELVINLQLKRYRHEAKFSGIGNSACSASFAVQTTIGSRLNSFEAAVECIILPSISGYHPEATAISSDWIRNDISIADPYFYKPKRVERLIGAELFFDLLREGKIRYKHSGPTLQNTVFGWVASGTYKENPPARCISYSTLVATEDNNLDLTLRKFWEIERIPDLRKSQLYTPDQVMSEKSFASTISRDSTGKFVVILPFKWSSSCLGSSYETARRRFLSLERRMKGNPKK